jgi:hypothetical protein
MKATETLSKTLMAKLATERKTVRVWKVDAEGKPVIDQSTKQRVAEDVPIAAEHIFAHRVEGESVHIVTVDGQKLTVELPAK